ncbi:hypothetical protein APHAL10511_003763 [Amanita phalloides]|nr:hypothetical protein APHAL10511_003763 [Amanita phalloides]
MNRAIGVPASPAKRDRDKDKEKSPIRQSIMNVLSVFINKRSAPGEKRVAPDLDLEPEPERQYGFKPGTDFERNAFETRTAVVHGACGKALPSVPPPSAPGDDGGTKRPRGVALYDAPVSAISLANGALSDSAPKKKQLCGSVWLPCIATLEAEDRSIRLSWSTSSPEGEHVLTHIVSLARCADVRSLVPSQLDEQDTKLPLVGCKDELRIQEFKVFEVLFQGREPEKFAAKTVRDRARWVSAIWDVVLPSQDQRSFNQVRTETLNRGGNANASTPLPSSAIRNLSSSSIYPPTRSASRLSASGSVSTTTPERCRSPSIMSLNQKSVVKQRLAQIKDLGMQRTCSVSSASGRTASKKGSLSHHRWNGNGQPTCVSDAVADQENISARSDPEITRSIPDIIQAPSNIEPLLGLLQNHAHEHREQVTHLEDQLIGLQDEIQRLPKELSCIVGNSRTDNAPSIQQMVTKVDRKMESTADVLGVIEDKLTSLTDDYQKQAGVESTRDKNAADALRAIDGIRVQIKSDFPAVLARLAQIQEVQKRNEKIKNDRPPLAERNKDPPPVVDLSTVLSKLDAMIALQRKATTPVGRAGGKASCTDVSGKDIKDDLAKVFSLLEDNNQQRALHTQQQADSVRYLTELNTWLEAFVNHGTSQIESVAANVEQLCKILGSPDQGVDGTGQTSLLQDLRGLVSNAQTQQSSAELQNSINGLLAVMNNSRLSELGSIAGVVERYRQDQVNLLKTMKTELSSEIKGERIRFVEAMKEATSINVQTHVENLKQNLAAEVLKMSNEVGRLHQEKQALESQIQDMLAFQDKQRFSNRAVEQAGIRYCHPYLEEYPIVTGQGEMSFSGI